MRFTFVAFDAFPLLDTTASGGIGGAEVRATTFARGLQRLGQKDIEFVVRARDGLPDQVGGFAIRPYARQKSRGFARLSKLGESLAKRVTGTPPLDPFFRDLHSDVLLCFGVRNDTASIVRSAKETGKSVVLFLTSDRNLEDAQRQGRSDRGVYGELGHLCRFAIEHADRVVVQTPYQLAELERVFGIRGTLIRNPIELLPQDSASQPNNDPLVLWVGRADRFSKRADLALEVAERCPDVRFRLIMNNHDSETFEEMVAAAPSNVEIVERVSFDQIESHFQAASLLFNTSVAEGFPNSFLQACKFGKPIVSLQVDPGSIFSEHGVGHCANGDIDRMARAIVFLCSDRGEYELASKRALKYVGQFHNSTNCCEQLNDLLQELVRPRSRRAA